MKVVRIVLAVWLGFRAYRATHSVAVGLGTVAAIWMFLPAAIHLVLAEVSRD